MSDQAIVMAHPSPDLYGSDRVLLETVSGYVERGHEVVVVLPGEGPLAPALVERGAEVRYLRFPVLRKSLLSPRGLITLTVSVLGCLPGMIRLLRGRRPSLVLVNTVTIPVWILAARLVRVPVVCHVHEAEQSAKRIVRKVLYLPLLAATGLIVNSRFSLNVLTQSWPTLTPAITRGLQRSPRTGRAHTSGGETGRSAPSALPRSAFTPQGPAGGDRCRATSG